MATQQIGTVEEQSPARLRLDFSGFDKTPETPTSLYYRIDLDGANPPINIRPQTQVPSVATQVDVILDRTDNDYYSGVGEAEYHVITVTTNLNQSDELNKTLVYEVTRIDAAPLFILLFGSIGGSSSATATLSTS